MSEITAQLATAKEFRAHIKQMLTQRLRDAHAKNEAVNYSELTAISGLDVTTSRGRYYVDEARKILQEKEGIVFECITGIGYKPIPVGKMASQFGSQATSKIQSATQQFRRNLETINPQKLKDGEEIQELIRESVRCAYYEQMQQRSTVLVDAAAEESQRLEQNKNTIKQSIAAAHASLWKLGVG